jgi:hypothetical protein
MRMTQLAELGGPRNLEAVFDDLTSALSVTLDAPQPAPA